MKVNFFYKKVDAAEVDNLLTKYYEGYSTARDEARLCTLLESPALPEQFLPDRAVLKFFEKKRNLKKQKDKKRYSLMWSAAATVTLLFSVGIYILQNQQHTAYAYVDGHKVTDTQKVREQALASIQVIAGSCNEVEHSLNQLDSRELIDNQLSVFNQADIY